MKAWIGFDLDGTLAEHDGGGIDTIGRPVPAMVAKLREHLAAGDVCKIFTARVSGTHTGHPAMARRQRDLVEDWCQAHLGRVLPITCVKDFACRFFYDDRARQVIPNTGRIVEETAPMIFSPTRDLLTKREVVSGRYEWMAECQVCGFERRFAILRGVATSLQCPALLQEAEIAHAEQRLPKCMGVRLYITPIQILCPAE